jgi:hypothetical protein
VLSAQGYCSRWSFILDRCKGKGVFHLGFVGETDESLEAKVRAFREGRVLHPHVARVASEVVGLDRDAQAVKAIQAECNGQTLLAGDVEHLGQLGLNRSFDVILFGDVLEHLTCPGLALDGIRQFMNRESELIVSTPNAFALMANIRFTTGRFHEGSEHVAAYSKYTLPAILSRHGMELTELYTCFDRPPQTKVGKFKLALGYPVFKAIPDRGGTLLAVAKRAA